MIKFLTFYKFKKMISLLDISSVWGVRYDTSGLHRSSYEKGAFIASPPMMNIYSQTQKQHYFKD